MKNNVVALLLSASLALGNIGSITFIDNAAEDNLIIIEDQEESGFTDETDEDSDSLIIISEEPSEESSDEASDSKSVSATEDGLSEIVIIDEEESQESETTDSSENEKEKSAEAVADSGTTFEELTLDIEDLPVDEMWTTFQSLTEGEDYVSDEIICSVSSAKEAEEIAEIYGGVVDNFEYGVATIDISESEMSVKEAFKCALMSHEEYPLVEPNYIISFEDPIDQANVEEDYQYQSYKGSAWEEQYYENGHNDTRLNPTDQYYQWHHDVIDTYGAWGVSLGNPDVVVAIIDSGVNYKHDDLKNNILDISDDIDVNNNHNMDVVGHGTHVAGIVGAMVDNKVGGSGVAPEVSLMPICVSDTNGSPRLDYMARAIRYVAGATDDEDESTVYSVRRADIINMSISTKVYNAILEEAVNIAYKQGVTFVASAGNDGANIISYPAYLDHVIAVGATDRNNDLSDFSNTGKWTDISAPGVNIFSTYWDKTAPTKNGRYAMLSGTSMSTPVVAGACALYMSAMGHVDPDTMESALKKAAVNGVVNIAGMFDGKSTTPVLDLYANDGDEDYANTLIARNTNAGTYSTPYKVSTDSVLVFTARDISKTIVYTTDGQSPSVVDGEIKVGTVYDGKPITVSDFCGILTGEKKFTIKAVAITGVGVVSKVTGLSFVVDPSMAAGSIDSDFKDAVSVKIQNAPLQLVAGKSVSLQAKILPVTYEQKVLWKIESYSDGDLSKATISSEGKLSTPSGKSGTLTVSCSTVDGRRKDTVTIRVLNDVLPVSKIEMPSDMSIKFDSTKGDGGSNKKTLAITTLKDSAGNDLLKKNTVSFEWTSNNAEVASVSAQSQNATKATVIAKGVGTAKITCKVLDGSGKSVSCNVKVTGGKIVNSVSVYTTTEDDKYDFVFNKDGSVKSIALSATPCITVKAVQKNGNDVLENVADPVWTVENKKVVGIDPDGKEATITALSKGSTKVTCAARDGSGKKFTFTVSVKKIVTAITITGQNYVAPGASATYKTTVLPADANDKGVIWHAVSSNDKEIKGVTINASGKLTVGKDVKAGTVIRIYAESKDKGDTYGKFDVVVASKTQKVTVSAEDSVSDLYLGITSSAKEGYRRSVELTAVADTGIKLEFKSSDSRIASLGTSSYNSKTGKNKVTLTANAKGTVTVYATARDGSGKSAKVSIKVRQLVKGLTVTGQDNIARGNSSAYKATCANSDADERGVKWSLIGDNDALKAAGVTIDEKSGKVTVSKTAILGSYKVRATAKDGSGIKATKTFIVSEAKAKQIALEVDSEHEKEPIFNVVRTNKGVLTSLQLCDVNIDNKSSDDNPVFEGDEREIRLSAIVDGKNADNVLFTSSNNKVATVSEDGTIRALSKGKAVITGTVNDGSGKKTSVTVNVITPASGISITIANKQQSRIAYGKSATAKAAIQNTYGKPSNHKVAWDYETVVIKGDKYFTIDESLQNELKKKKCFFTFSDGKITVNSKSDYDKNLDKYGYILDELGATGFALMVTAKTTDGTEYSATKFFLPNNPTTTLELYAVNSGELVTSEELTLDGYSKMGAAVHKSGDLYWYRYRLSSDGIMSEFEVTSSNPEVASAYATQSNKSIFYIHPNKKGSTTIKIKALDGTGKTLSINVKVIESAKK